MCGEKKNHVQVLSKSFGVRYSEGSRVKCSKAEDKTFSVVRWVERGDGRDQVEGNGLVVVQSGLKRNAFRTV